MVWKPILIQTTSSKLASVEKLSVIKNTMITLPNMNKFIYNREWQNCLMTNQAVYKINSVNHKTTLNFLNNQRTIACLDRTLLKSWPIDPGTLKSFVTFSHIVSPVSIYFTLERPFSSADDLKISAHNQIPELQKSNCPTKCCHFWWIKTLAIFYTDNFVFYFIVINIICIIIYWNMKLSFFSGQQGEFTNILHLLHRNMEYRLIGKRDFLFWP